MMETNYHDHLYQDMFYEHLIHQRISFRRPPRQGLRCRFRRPPRSPSRKRSLRPHRNRNNGDDQSYHYCRRNLGCRLSLPPEMPITALQPLPFSSNHSRIHSITPSVTFFTSNINIYLRKNNYTDILYTFMWKKSIVLLLPNTYSVYYCWNLSPCFASWQDNALVI